MFETSFNVIIRIPRSGLSHTWEGVQLMGIIAASVLLGALVVAIATLGLDTKRALKLRSMRKELRRLQEALQNAQQSLQEAKMQAEEEHLPPVEEEISEEAPVEFTDSSSATPEDITKSFEDTIEKSDLLESPKKRLEEEPTDHDIEESDIRTKVTAEEKEKGEETEQEESAEDEEVQGKDESEETEQEELTEDEEKDTTTDKDEELLEDVPVEAELIENEEDSQKKTET
jgi:hypothetical protein